MTARLSLFTEERALYERPTVSSLLSEADRA